MPKQTIGEFLALQRRARGMTQQEVADRLGISNKTLSSWESGRSYPDILTLPALAEIYGVTVDEILSGERAPQDRERGVGREAQKKLLKNALNRYSIKCTALAGVGIGGVGLFALALLLSSVATWLFVLFAVLSALTELTVVILFVVFEKSALLFEEEKSRYSLMIKRMTYRAASRIVFAMFALLLCMLIAVPFTVGVGVVTVSMVLAVVALAAVALSALLLVWLFGRGKEFYTAKEAASLARNRKLARKIFSIGGAIAAFLFVAASVLSSMTFTHLEKPLDLPKEEFIRLVQTVEISQNGADYELGIQTGNGSSGDYFVDVKAALSKPVERELFEKHGSFHQIEGDLYFSYLIDDDGNDNCYVSYIPDPSEPYQVIFCSGSVWYRNGAEFKAKHPEPTAEDLILGMEEEEVFFILNSRFRTTSSETDGFGGYRYCSENYVEVSDERYALVLLVEQTYPFIALIGFCGIFAVAVGCFRLYRKRRDAVDFSALPDFPDSL